MGNCFGLKLKELRKKAGVSALDVAEELGVKRQMIYLYEKGKCQPTLDMAIKTAHLFNVSLDVFKPKDQPND